MGKEVLLPKNIRQIGDIRGREKVCVEDYVMTYIRKKEAQEDKGYLGLLLGERQETEDAVYLFIRGILEFPDPNRRGEKTAGEGNMGKDPGKDAAGKGNHGEDQSKEAAAKGGNGKDQSKEAAAKEAYGEGRNKKITGKAASRENESEKAENRENGSKKAVSVENRQKKPTGEWEEKTLSLRELIDRERETYFPGWEIQGCCVIGTYPTKRLERLGDVVPECKKMIYHLQEQEETVYLNQDGQYRRINGYFVFYEQNRKMQEYLANVFGEESVDKEGASDEAIKNFREKVKEKGRLKSRNVMKMASSFFVIGVLAIGAVMVNRIDMIQRTGSKSTSGEVSRYQVQQEVSGDGLQEAEPEMELAGSDAFGEELPEDRGTSEPAGSAGVSGDVSVVSQGNVGSADNAAASGDGAGVSDVSSGRVGDPGNTEVSEDSAGMAGSTEIPADSAGASGSVEASADSAGMAGSTEIPADSAGTSGSVEVSADSAGMAGSTEIPADSAGASGSVEASADSAGMAGSAEIPVDSAGTSENGADSSGSVEAASRQVRAAYVIKVGDTLAGICQKYYGSMNQLEEICSVNGISDADMILPGQKIVLP